MAHHVQRRHRLPLSITLAVVLAAGSAGCSNDSSSLPPPASPAPVVTNPASALSPEDAEAAEAILAAFDNYMEALIELSTAGVPGGTDETMARLEEVHVGGELYNELAFDLLTENFLAGHATAGTITWDAEVIEIDWDHTFEHRPDEVVPEATLLACLDESRWTTVANDTGEVVFGPGERYTSTVTATWRDEDPHRPNQKPRWEITVRSDSTSPC